MKVFWVNPINGEMDSTSINLDFNSSLESHSYEDLGEFGNSVPTSSLPPDVQIKLMQGETISPEELQPILEKHLTDDQK